MLNMIENDIRSRIGDEGICLLVLACLDNDEKISNNSLFKRVIEKNSLEQNIGVINYLADYCLELKSRLFNGSLSEILSNRLYYIQNICNNKELIIKNYLLTEEEKTSKESTYFFENYLQLAFPAHLIYHKIALQNLILTYTQARDENQITVGFNIAISIIYTLGTASTLMLLMGALFSLSLATFGVGDLVFALVIGSSFNFSTAGIANTFSVIKNRLCLNSQFNEAKQLYENSIKCDTNNKETINAHIKTNIHNLMSLDRIKAQPSLKFSVWGNTITEEIATLKKKGEIIQSDLQEQRETIRNGLKEVESVVKPIQECKKDVISVENLFNYIRNFCS